MPAQRREDGVVLIEFALVLPMLLLLILGFLQLGIATNAKIDSTHLSAEGARYGVVNQNPDSAVTLQKYLLDQTDTADLRNNAEVCINFPTNPETGTQGKVGDPVRVQINYLYSLIPFLGDRLSSDTVGKLPISSDAIMRLEALPTNYTAGCVVNPP